MSDAAPDIPEGVSFEEPWQARAYGVALDLVRSLGVPWESFRVELVAAIDDAPTRPYFESWVVALERFAAHHQVSTDHDLAHERAESAAYRYHEDGIDTEATPIAARQSLARWLNVSLPGQVELARTFGGDGHPNSWVVRRFGPDGTVAERRALSADEWHETLALALAVSPVATPR